MTEDVTAKACRYFAPCLSDSSRAPSNSSPFTHAGMVFIPSQGGLSHSPREFSDWEACVNGANVLLRAALKMAEA